MKSKRKEPSLKEVIGLRVGYIRRREGYSQSELAKEIGLTRIMLSNIESGRVALKLHVAWKLSEFLFIHPNWIYFGGDDCQGFPYFDKVDMERLDQIYCADQRSVFSECWETMGLLLLEAENKHKNKRLIKLTVSSTNDNLDDVKDEWPKLKRRLQSITSQSGEKSKLAKFLDVDITQLSKWLTNGDSAREPGASYTLRLLKWVEQQERQK